jgi:hypothetical protein
MRRLVRSIGLFEKDELMRYLGIIKKRHAGQIILEGYGEAVKSAGNDEVFEAFEVESIVVLVPAPVDRLRLAQIETLAGQSIIDHRKTLEGLAR